MPRQPEAPAQRHADGGQFLALGLLALAVSAPAIVQAVQALKSASDQSPDHLLHPLFLHLALLTTLLALVGRSRRVLWLLAPAAFLALPESLYTAWFGLPTGPHVYGVLADTDAAETLSWLGPWLWPAVLASVLWLLLIARLAYGAWHANWAWKHRSRFWVLTAAALALGGFGAMQWWFAPSFSKADELEHNAFVEISIEAPELGFLETLSKTFPWGLPLRLRNFQEHLHALQSHQAAVAHFDFGVRWRAVPPTERQIHVLVIGETGRADHWQLFGATRQTTPLLSARSDLLPFKDAVSAASATRESVPLMLTRRPPEAMLAPSDEPSLITAFKQAGFKTYWLSTQGAAGRHETPISALAGESDQQHFVNAVDYRGSGALDGDLLPRLEAILARREPRQLIVLHTLGSHLNYAHRYPTEFERFQPALRADEQPDIWRPTHVPELRNAYDNSVLYTDFVLNQVIEQVAGTGAAATLLFAADHGETLFDGNCGSGGHGFASEVNYRIPFFIWTSPAWNKQRAEALKALQAHESAPVSALSIFATMNGLAGFDVAQPSAHGDLSLASWAPAPRQIAHFGDFDRDLKGKSCSSKPAAGG